MPGEAAASGLRFFLDRGLGSLVVPRALRAAGWVLETMDERYGADRSQEIQDAQWIEEATLRGDILLCKDLAIARNALEAQVIYMTSARVFALSSASLAGPVMAQWYLGNEAKNCHHGAQGKGTVRHGRESFLQPPASHTRLPTQLMNPLDVLPVAGWEKFGRPEPPRASLNIAEFRRK